MFVDATLARDGEVVASDVCVVGAGAAGITLALALARHGLSVNLVESGGLEPDAATQRLYEGASVGTRYAPSASRLRYFGGSTNHWGGLCRTLDECDFVPHAWVEHSGWPIRKADLDPYYDAALGVLDLPHHRRFTEVERDTDAYPRLLAPDNGALEPLLWLKSPPTRMGEKNRAEIARHPRIRCHLHANAVEVVLNPAGSAVLRLAAQTLAGRHLAFSARQYVLAAGGIENARLLLLSDSVVPGGIGNRYDLVGRYFLEHPNLFVGRMVVTSPPGKLGYQEENVQQRSQRDLPGVWDLFFGFGTTIAVREQHRLLGFSVNAIHADPGSGAVSAAVGELVADPMGRGDGATCPRTYTLAVIAEQAPNPRSRVFLGAERDALGQRTIIVDLRMSPLDVRSIRKSLALFGLELARSGRGRIQVRDFDEANLMTLMGHQMGTTRMSDDPRQGVTDRNGTVHGLANLHLAGSSLFPTGGGANPTLTIVALALRQADWLKVATERRAPELSAGE